MTKPPLGLTPNYIWKSRRLREIREAIRRYYIADLPIPTEWFNELHEFEQEAYKRQQQ